MWPLPAVSSRLVIAAAILSLAFAVGWSVNGWRLGRQIDQIKLDAAQTQLSGYRAAMSALETQRARSAEIVAQATAEAGRLRQALATQRAKYNQAVQEEPECSEQASQPLRCPPAW
jgi:hypothetical protein